MSDQWTESFVDADVFEQERVNAERDEWQHELARDRQIALEHPMNRMVSNEERRKKLEPRYAKAAKKFYGKDAA